jgi:hypothetical protein
LKIATQMRVVMKVSTVMIHMTRPNSNSKRKEPKKKLLLIYLESIKEFAKLSMMTQCCSKMKFLPLSLYLVKYGLILKSHAVLHSDLKDLIIIHALHFVIQLVQKKD